MKPKDIPEYDTFPYKEACTSCKKEYTVYTQEDAYPEYYTDVYVSCECGDVVHFELPVN